MTSNIKAVSIITTEAQAKKWNLPDDTQIANWTRLRTNIMKNLLIGFVYQSTNILLPQNINSIPENPTTYTWNISQDASSKFIELWNTLVKGPRGSTKQFKTFPNYSIGDYQALIAAIRDGVLKVTRKNIKSKSPKEGIKERKSKKIKTEKGKKKGNISQNMDIQDESQIEEKGVEEEENDIDMKDAEEMEEEARNEEELEEYLDDIDIDMEMEMREEKESGSEKEKENRSKEESELHTGYEKEGEGEDESESEEGAEEDEEELEEEDEENEEEFEEENEGEEEKEYEEKVEKVEKEEKVKGKEEKKKGKKVLEREEEEEEREDIEKEVGNKKEEMEKKDKQEVSEKNEREESKKKEERKEIGGNDERKEMEMRESGSMKGEKREREEGYMVDTKDNTSSQEVESWIANISSSGREQVERSYVEEREVNSNSLLLKLARGEIEDPMRPGEKWSESSLLQNAFRELKGTEKEVLELQELQDIERRIEEYKFELKLEMVLKRGGLMIMEEEKYRNMILEKNQAISDREILSEQVLTMEGLMKEARGKLEERKKECEEIEREMEEARRKLEEIKEETRKAKEKGEKLDKLIVRANSLVE